MIEKSNTVVFIGVSLKAKLEIQAEEQGMKYREYLSHLADNAVDQSPLTISDEPTRQTRFTLNVATKDRVRFLSKQASCSQERWLLNVFQAAAQES